MNGKYITLCALKRDDYTTYGVAKKTSDQTRIGNAKGGKWLEFRFADLETRDALPGETAETVAAKYAGLRTLVVKVWRSRDSGMHPTREHRNPLEEERVPEKALKGRAMAVSASLEPVKDASPCPLSNRLVHLDTEPVATFKFKYGTKSKPEISFFWRSINCAQETCRSKESYRCQSSLLRSRTNLSSL